MVVIGGSGSYTIWSGNVKLMLLLVVVHY
jgi:hypothetical protein